MTLAEVEALLDGPPTDTFEMPAEWKAYRWVRRWKAAGAWAEVEFAPDGLVTAAAGRERPQPGIIVRLRSWLGW